MSQISSFPPADQILPQLSAPNNKFIGPALQ